MATKDFERVLAEWREMGRSGLSVQALSEICGRAITIRELARRRHLVFNYCNDIRAPIVLANASPYERGGRRREQWEAEFMLAQYPWPEYKGLRNLKGQKTTGIGEGHTARLLRAKVNRAYQSYHLSNRPEDRQRADEGRF